MQKREDISIRVRKPLYSSHTYLIDIFKKGKKLNTDLFAIIFLP